MILSPISIEINASNYTAIKSADDPEEFYAPFGFYTEDGTDWYLATSLSGDNEVLVPLSTAGLAPVFKIKPDADGTIIFAKGTTTTNLVALRGPR